MPLPQLRSPATGTGCPVTALFPLLIILLAGAIYANTLQAPFVFDDPYYIISNPAVKHFRYYHDGELVRRAITQEALDQNFLTRRVTFFSFALNYRLHGLRVEGYHVANILIHIGNGLLVYWLVLLTLQTPGFAGGKPRATTGMSPHVLALFAALIFVAHPIQTQAVTYTCQRFTSLATFFFLASISLYVRWRLHGTAPETAPPGKETPVPYWLSLGAATIAMLTKEIAFTLPFVLFLYEGIFFGVPDRRRFLTLTPFAATLLIIPALVLWGGAEYTDIKNLTTSMEGGGQDNAALTYLLTQFRVIVTYLRLLVLPVNQHFDYDVPRATSFFQGPVMLSFALLASFVGLGVYLLRTAAVKQGRNRGWQRLLAFGIFWFFLTLAVESSFIPLLDLLFEHRLYLPSVGFFLVLLALVGMVSQQTGNVGIGRAIGAALLILVVSLAIAAALRNRVWQDSIVLFEDNVRHSPRKARPLNVLADEYYKWGRYEEAFRTYTTALACATEFQDILNGYTGLENIYRLRGDNVNLRRNYLVFLEKLHDFLKNETFDKVKTESAIGIVYGKLGRWSEAEALLRQAVASAPDFSLYHLSLGKFYLTQNRLDEALTEISEAVRLHGEGDLAQEGLGDVLIAIGRTQEGLAAYLRTREINPDLAGIHRKIAQVYITLGQVEEAAEVLWQEVATGQADPTLFKSLGSLHEQLQQFAEAERAFSLSLQRDDKNAMANKNLGDYYLRREQFEQAAQYLAQAALLDPGNSNIRFNLGFALEGQGKRQEAIEAYQKTLELAPSDQEARGRLALLLGQNTGGP